MTMKQQIASAAQKPTAFARDFFSYAVKGGNLYYGWLLFLSFFVLVGLYTTYVQMTPGPYRHRGHGPNHLGIVYFQLYLYRPYCCGGSAGGDPRLYL